MKYSQDTAESGEVLRMILQKMVLHPAAFTPPNYAVWYEHLSGINPALSNAMTPLLEKDGSLDDDLVERLYAQYVSECSSDLQKYLRGGIRQMLSRLVESTAQASREAIHFGGCLQTHKETLNNGLDSAALRSLLDNLACDTGQMRGSMQTLEVQLEASKQEVEHLNKEIESVRAEALTDPLSNILNRRGFEAAAQLIFDDDASNEKEFCMLMIDIDHFKKVNDTYGHLFGDKVIRTIASTLKSKVKGQDSVARIGGEEFAVLLPDTNAKGAFVVAEQIRLAIENGKIRRLDSSEQIGGISISIGIASHTRGDTLLELLDQADKALYIAKQGGRNRSIIFTANSA